MFNQSAPQFPNFRQFLLHRANMPAEIVEYIYAFNLPEVNGRQYKKHINNIYKHLRLTFTFGGRYIKASNALFITYYGYTLKGCYMYADTMTHADRFFMECESADTTEYIKYHVAKYGHKQEYALKPYEKYDLVVAELKKCTYTCHYRAHSKKYNNVMTELKYIEYRTVQNNLPMSYDDYFAYINSSDSEESDGSDHPEDSEESAPSDLSDVSDVSDISDTEDFAPYEEKEKEEKEELTEEQKKENAEAFARQIELQYIEKRTEYVHDRFKHKIGQIQSLKLSFDSSEFPAWLNIINEPRRHWRGLMRRVFYRLHVHKFSYDKSNKQRTYARLIKDIEKEMK